MADLHARTEVDTAAIRAGLHRSCRTGTNEPCITCGDFLRLCDALDAARAENLTYADRIADLVCDLNETREDRDDARGLAAALEAELAEVRALCEREARAIHETVPIADLRAVLDRATSEAAP